MNADNENFADQTLFDSIVSGIIIGRDADGNVITNIPHLVTHHSPTGYEFGYGGSGPADLALNICEVMLNRLGWKGEREKMWRGDCWRKAYELHQEFKWEFIASIDKMNGKTIPYQEVEQWFAKHITGLAEKTE